MGESKWGKKITGRELNEDRGFGLGISIDRTTDSERDFSFLSFFFSLSPSLLSFSLSQFLVCSRVCKRVCTRGCKCVQDSVGVFKMVQRCFKGVWVRLEIRLISRGGKM